MRQSRRDGTARGGHGEVHVPAGSLKCLSGQFDLPAGAYGIEPSSDHEQSATIGSQMGRGSVRTRLVL